MAKPNENTGLIDRVRERLGHVNLSASGASMQAFGNDGTIRNILEGKSKNPRADTMEKLAAVLQTSTEYLLKGGDPEAFVSVVKPLPKRENQHKLIRVFASVEGGDGAMAIESEPIEWVGMPNVEAAAQDDDLFGVVVEGVSMGRLFRAGDTVWIHPRFRERRDEACVFRQVNDVTGEVLATIKWLVDFNSQRWVVEQAEPEKRFELLRSEWPECFRVLGKKNR